MNCLARVLSEHINNFPAVGMNLTRLAMFVTAVNLVDTVLVTTSVGESTFFMPKIVGVRAHDWVPEPIRSCRIVIFLVVLPKIV